MSRSEPELEFKSSRRALAQLSQVLSFSRVQSSVSGLSEPKTCAGCCLSQLLFRSSTFLLNLASTDKIFGAETFSKQLQFSVHFLSVIDLLVLIHGKDQLRQQI